MKTILKGGRHPNQCEFTATVYIHKETKRKLCRCARLGCSNYGYGEAERLTALCKTPKVLLGESVAAVIQVLGMGLIRPVRGCNCEKRKDALNQYSWTPPDWVVRLLGMKANTVQELVDRGEVVPLDT